MNFHLSRLTSPLGDLLLVTDESHVIRALDFAGHERHLHRALRASYGRYEWFDAPAPPFITDALARYFAGEWQALDALAVATRGTPLQEQVWQALRRIPAGTTTSYGKLAKALGFADPRAAIDIGAANGANPIALVVPCHRVIASDGSLKGYAWGLDRKRWLLTHENAISVPKPVPQTGTLPGF